MALAKGQLVRMQLPSGLFPYDYDFATGASASMSDIALENMARQTGVAFALAQYLTAFDSPPLRKTIGLALQAFDDRSLPFGKGRVQSVLENIGLYNRWQIWTSWRKPLNALGLLYAAEGDGAVVSANDSHERVGSGATALALIAELKYRAVTGDDRFQPARARWLRGLFALHVPGRGFREAPHHLTESPYVNGQAWLALAEYARAFPKDRNVAKLLAEIDGYMMTRYGAKPNELVYSWSVMAAAVRADATGDPRFKKYIRDLTTWMVSTRRQFLDAPHNSCASVEGLATAYRILRNGQAKPTPLPSTLRSWISQVMPRNRTMQIRPGKTRLTRDDGTMVTSERLAAYAGAFLLSTGSSRTQIDITGHCLSALFRMRKAGLGVGGE